MQEEHGPLMLHGQCHDLGCVLRKDCPEYKVLQIAESQKKEGSGATPSQLEKFYFISRDLVCKPFVKGGSQISRFFDSPFPGGEEQEDGLLG